MVHYALHIIVIETMLVVLTELVALVGQVGLRAALKRREAVTELIPSSVRYLHNECLNQQRQSKTHGIAAVPTIAIHDWRAGQLLASSVQMMCALRAGTSISCLVCTGPHLTKIVVL
mgnify:CR=1 FL=1